MDRMSRRRLLGGFAGAAAGLALARCGGDDDSTTPSATATSTPAANGTAGGGTTPATPSPAPGEPSPTATPGAPTPAGPTIEEMAGGILVLGFRGPKLDTANPIVADIRDRHVGGVVLFSYDVPSDSPVRNVASPAQLAALCADLRAVAPGQPLLIAIDEEGGVVDRLGTAHGFPATQSAEALGRGPVEGTRTASQAIAATLRDAGINLNFAPVVDVNTNPENPIIGALGRSFSSDPDLVAAHARAFIDGQQERGIITALKHFPGHGSSTGDSHAGLVDVTGTWANLELDPYRTLFAQGYQDLVMVAHVFNAQIDDTYPASLSAATIGGLLRGQLGFEGVVVSDDMGMGAITQEYGQEEAIRLALLAGNDLLVFGNNLEVFEPELGARVTESIASLVRRGDVPEARLREAYGRVQARRAGAR